MTRNGVLYDPTVPDPAVLDIDGLDFYATGWAADLADTPAPGHKPGCMWAEYGVDTAYCPCQPPL